MAEDTDVHRAACQRFLLRMVVEGLPKRLQQVVVLHYFADMSIDSIAKQLGVASGTVKRDLFDAQACFELVAERRERAGASPRRPRFAIYRATSSAARRRSVW